MKLVIVTTTPHYKVGERLYAFGPYTLEIEPWADLFETVLIAAPCRWATPPGDFLAFTKPNISILPQRARSDKTIWDHILFYANLPRHFLNLSRALQKGEAIQVRLPGWLGLLGAVLAPFFTNCLIANYAGQWNGYVSEPFTWRLQRFILRSWWWRNGLVTVYGNWPNQPKQIIPFFTSTMTAKQVRNGTEAARHKRLSSPLHILFVGRLITEKGVDILLQAAGILLKQQSIPFKLSIVGDGPDRNRLVRLVEQLELVDHVQFSGALPYDEVMSWYEKAHVLVLPSQSEGWGKVLLEAMCYGVICVATDTGPIPWMLKDRGFVVPYGDVEALATRLQCIVEDPVMYQNLSKAASTWAQNYSIEKVREALSRLLKERWDYEFFKSGYT